MNIAKATEDSRIDLNGYKTVDRSVFPAHWSDDFIQDLAHRPGWIKYFQWSGYDCYETMVHELFYEWSVWHSAMVNTLESLTAGGISEDDEEAVNGVRHAMETMRTEFTDILEFISKTSGKWEEPSPSEEVQTVDQAS